MLTILEKVYNSSLKFLVPLNPEETYSLIIKEAMRLVHADIGTIYLEQRGELERVYASNPVLYKIKPRKNGFTYGVFKSQKPIILSSQQVEKIHPEFKETHANSDIILPLYYKDKSLGVLSIQSGRKNFTQADLDVLKLFVPLATLAIRKTELYDEAQKALEVRDKFISMASHELRTPLTSVIGYIQLLKNKSNGDPSTARWLDQLALESNRLGNLVKELLEINSIKTGQLHYVWIECSVNQLIQRAIQSFGFSYPDHIIIFKDESKKPDKIIGDADKLLQALTNLLDNAIKFSSDQANTEITLSRNTQQLIITIQDQGRGIAKKDLHRIFEGFYKTDEFKHGMGLGLYLTKEIIDRHHGTIKLNSSLKKGTKVTIKLPKANL